MSGKVENLKILSNKKLTGDYFVLDLLSSGPLPEISPGQFVQVRIDNCREVFLRIPVSVYDYDGKSGIISLLIKEVGAGTSSLALLKEGEEVNLVFPLGKGFTIPAAGETVLLAGGGVGVAPLYLMGKTLKDKGINFKFLLGYRSENHILEYEKFSESGEVLITTEDGSAGLSGLIINHPELKNGAYDRIYCCGPLPMMKAVAAIASERGIWCEVSLENMMACGIGACLCCVEDTIEGHKCTCTEGPVFNINQLKWQI